jgi:hypothetical protein
MFFIPLAQSVETAKGTVSLLQTILSGGPLLILACLVVVMGVIIYKQQNRLAGLEENFRKSNVSLLREQLAQSGPLTEALTQTRVALKDNTTKLGECTASIANLEGISTRLEVHLTRLESQ